MEETGKGLKKKDWILISVIIGAAVLMMLFHMLSGTDGEGTVTVKVDGIVTGSYSLSQDQEIEINGGTNTLRIRDGKAQMTYADCPDQICVRHKAISRNHESIICLPNKVVVEVTEGQDREYDAVTN